MNTRLTAQALIAVAACALLLLPGAAAAKKKKRKRPYWYQYSVAFNCGEADETASVVPAAYETSINVLNPHAANAVLRKRVSLTFPAEDEMQGANSDMVQGVLGADKATQISCDDLVSPASFVMDPPPEFSPFVQGFVILVSNRPLTVSATQTATGATGEVSLQVDQIPSRPMYPRAVVAAARRTVCHRPPGNPANSHTITVGVDAWPAHRLHGDDDGACDDEDSDSGPRR